MSEYYDIEGNPISMMDWVVLIESRDMTEYGIIGNDYITNDGEQWDKIRVSTIWLGLNHNFGGVGPPLIFETMIFGLDEDDEIGDWQWRYATQEAALAGHDQAVALVRDVLAQRGC